MEARNFLTDRESGTGEPHEWCRPVYTVHYDGENLSNEAGYKSLVLSSV